MRNPKYSSFDPYGNVTFQGPLSLTRGEHSHMPHRTNAYLPGDERGHVNASSLGGVNSRANVVAQHRDVNHGSFLSVENGERAALKNSATIESEKTAFVNGPGQRPSAFTVNDSVTYADGHTETIHHSFANESYADQAAWNDMSASLPGTFDAPNPGDGLRETMDSEAYAALMESTDAEMPGLDADYAPADYSGAPGIDISTSADIELDSDTGAGSCSADSEDAGSADIGGADAGSGDGGASPEAD